MNVDLLDAVRTGLTKAGLSVVPTELYDALMEFYAAAVTVQDFGKIANGALAVATSDENHEVQRVAWKNYSDAMDLYDAKLAAVKSWKGDS